MGKKNSRELEKHDKYKDLSTAELLQVKKRDKYVLYELGCQSENPEEALAYLKKASSGGHLCACYALGEGFLSGRFQPQNEEMALEYFQSAGERGHVEAMIAAAQIYEERENWREAKRMYRRALDIDTDADEEMKNKHMLAKLRLAEAEEQSIYAQELESKDQMEAALMWYQLAAEKDDAEACYRLGRMNWDGTDLVPQNKDTGLMYLLNASRKGHIEAAMLASSIYEEKGMQEEAINCLKAAAHKQPAKSDIRLRLKRMSNEEMPPSPRGDGTPSGTPRTPRE